MKMDKDQTHMTERILNLTLEIIYLLTGEDYELVKKTSGEPLTPNKYLHWTLPITKPPPHCRRTVMNSAKKILEVTQKMTELLRREVPIRCQDVTVYFSMEEWEYLEGHKDLYKDVMIEDELDGSRKRNPPQRCPRPRDSSQEDLTILHHDQNKELEDLKIEVKEEEEEEEEETLVSGARHSMEEEEEMMTSKQEESSLYMNIHGSHIWKRQPLSTDCYVEDDDITQHSLGVNPITHNKQHRHFNSETSVDPSNPEEPSDQSYPVTPDTLQRSQTSERTIDPLNLEESLTYGVHTGEPSLSYFSSGNEKRFNQNGNLLKHQRMYKGERPFTCSECGKCFCHKKTLAVHKKIHTDVRPYVCSECGKSFIKKGDLYSHQRVHTGERPFLCTECGKRFTKKLGLTRHFKIHTGERPFSCSECGKSFTQHSILLRHKIIHTGEKSFSCSECGKRFSRKGSLVIHLRIHTRDRPFP